MEFEPHTTISHYRILSKIGAGGMGEVYLAHDSKLDRKVALKILPPDVAANPDRMRRFVQEAKSASALNHPNILTIYEIEEADSIHFIAMEFVEGETLRRRLRDESMKLGEALDVAIQIVSALAAAHTAGIVHRDIKPENIMLRRDGYVKVLDFGLAKLTETSAGQTVDNSAPTLPLQAHTGPGLIVGTPHYMSPEQAAGKQVDARSDIFSFGSVLYEMLMGQRAFEGGSSMEVVAAVLHREPKLLSPTLNSDLVKIVQRCLRKDPSRRFQTMSDLKVALEDLRDESRTDRQIHRPTRGLLWIGVSLFFLLAVVSLLAWKPWRASEVTEPLRAEALTTFPGQELYPSLSPNGDRVAFTWTGPKQDNTDIYVQQIGAGDPLRLTSDPSSDYNPVWSPDGRWIAFLRGNPATPLGQSDRELRLIAPLGGPERKVSDIRVQEITDVPVYLAWCPNSKCVIVTDTLGEGKPDALFVVSIETGDKRKLTDPRSPILADTNPSISADGKSLLFLRRTTWARGEIYVLPVSSDMSATGEPKHIPVSDLLPETATWMPDGNDIIFGTNPQNSGSAALWRISASGTDRPDRVPFVGDDGVMPVVSRSDAGAASRLVYVRSFIDENIWRLDFARPGVALAFPTNPTIASTKSDLHPQISPDSRRVAFTSTRSGAWEIWVSDPDGSNARQITSLKAPTGTGSPRWSPDGNTIVFASDAEGQFDIYTVPAAGGRPRNITSHPAFEHVPTFSQDGQWIYFSSTRSGEAQIWKVSVSGGEPLQVTKNGGWLSQESVDGNYLYFIPAAGIGAPTELWRIPTAGGQPVKVIEGVVNSTFAVLQRGIYYISQLSPKPELSFFDFNSQKSVIVVRDLGPSAEMGGLTASTDGRSLLFARRDSSVDDLMLVENFR